MRKWVLLTCVLGALAAHAETLAEQLQRLYKERVQIYFQTEKLKREIDAAVYDPAITSEAIAAARQAQTEARFAYEIVNAEAVNAERKGEDISQELRDKVELAAQAYENAATKLKDAVMAHPKIAEMKAEMDKADARAKEVQVEYEALQEKQKAEFQ